MSWKTFSALNAQKQLPKVTQLLRNRECHLAYSPLPQNATVTVAILPRWDVAAMQKNSSRGVRQVARFHDVKSIKATTQDTITMGKFESVECVTTEQSKWRFTLKDINGSYVQFEFSFSECELDLNKRMPLDKN